MAVEAVVAAVEAEEKQSAYLVAEPKPEPWGGFNGVLMPNSPNFQTASGSVSLFAPPGVTLHISEISIEGVQSKLTPPMKLIEQESLTISTKRAVAINWLESP